MIQSSLLAARNSIFIYLLFFYGSEQVELLVIISML